jgi:Flp pilus assembly protein TadG
LVDENGEIEKLSGFSQVFANGSSEMSPLTLMAKSRHGSSLRYRRSRCGAVAAEAAIVLPIFILAIIGIIEFGRAIMVQQILTNAAREGARRAIVQGATNDEVTELVDNYLVSTSLGAAGREIGILDENDGAIDLEDHPSHELIKVVVTVPTDEVVPIRAWFTDETMGAVCQMRKE